MYQKAIQQFQRLVDVEKMLSQSKRVGIISCPFPPIPAQTQPRGSSARPTLRQSVCKGTRSRVSIEAPASQDRRRAGEHDFEIRTIGSEQRVEHGHALAACRQLLIDM